MVSSNKIEISSLKVLVQLFNELCLASHDFRLVLLRWLWHVLPPAASIRLECLVMKHHCVSHFPFNRWRVTVTDRRV